VSGTVSGNVGIGLNCSAAAPCRNIQFQDVHLRTAANLNTMVKCGNVDTITGVVCNSTLPS
jgi:hypothetical protein